MLAYSHYDHTMMYITVESYISGHSCILSHILSTYLRAPPRPSDLCNLIGGGDQGGPERRTEWACKASFPFGPNFCRTVILLNLTTEAPNAVSGFSSYITPKYQRALEGICP